MVDQLAGLSSQPRKSPHGKPSRASPSLARTPVAVAFPLTRPPSRPAPLGHRGAVSAANKTGRSLQQANHPCVQGASLSPWFCLSGLEEAWRVILGQRKALGQGKTELPCGSCYCPSLGVSWQRMCISPGQRQDVNSSLQALQFPWRMRAGCHGQGPHSLSSPVPQVRACSAQTMAVRLSPGPGLARVFIQFPPAAAPALGQSRTEPWELGAGRKSTLSSSRPQ